MKKKEFSKKKFYIFMAIIFIVFLLGNSIFLYRKIMEMSYQITLLQDSSNVIQTNVANMYSNLELKLEEENSLLEQYSITVTEIDFAKSSYSVEVHAIPKDYTDDTKMYVYFGTTSYELEKSGYHYTTSVTLSLNTLYDGNVTFLLEDGDKKSTEVCKSYKGFQTECESLLKGELLEEPAYKDGKLLYEETCTYEVKSNDLFHFVNVNYMVEVDGDILYAQDMLSEEEEKSLFDFSKSEEEEVFASYEIENQNGQKEISLNHKISEESVVRIYLLGITKEGYSFEYTLFTGKTEEEDGFMESYKNGKGQCTIFDADKNWYRIP